MHKVKGHHRNYSGKDVYVKGHSRKDPERATKLVSVKVDKSTLKERIDIYCVNNTVIKVNWDKKTISFGVA